MKVLVIGGSGHIGTYLVPRLVELGHDVVNMTRGQSKPYVEHGAWKYVEPIVVDRAAEDAAGTFGARARQVRSDVIIDLICYDVPSARQLVEAVRGEVQHVLHCGTIWVYGYNIQVPATEEQPRRPLARYKVENAQNVDAYLTTDYGAQKAAVEAYLLTEARLRGFPATVLHPGHIVGVGHFPLNPQGNFNPDVFRRLARGETLILPNFGLETVHHVHGDDVAQAFVRAMTHWRASVGESFHVVSPAALTLHGYADSVAAWFGQEAKLAFMGWHEWRTTVSERDALATFDHIAHSPNASIDKARRLIDYQPRYSSLEAVFEALRSLIDRGMLDISG
jgi:nucleoside-diphosphate-sugar epimerase